ncbi:MAG TPA: hypothetical protein VN253_30100 [Kofleriaceae bacterium]|nr:hypothetical protein [Kofleriaceae bacterium]
MSRLGLLALVLALAGAAGCAQRLPPIATTDDARRANVELATLQEGRQLLLRKCGNCHRAPLPADHAAHEWPGKLDEMSARANLNPGQRRAIEQYLVAMAAAAPAPAAAEPPPRR